MCGICGVYNFVRDDPVDQNSLGLMTGMLSHRGPDDEGYFVDQSVGFGFRRLSIIDLAGGRQPMSDAEHTVWVVLNGEIYNFIELRSLLEGKGHRFRTSSDTEVIVHGYKEWGTEVLTHLNGMFGLAIWDTRARTLLLARDRIGIKPLYYRINARGIQFASEMRCLLPKGTSPAIDMEALATFLRYRYTPSPKTLLEGVNKLPAGTSLLVQHDEITRHRWWQPCTIPSMQTPRPEEAADELTSLYRQAVRRQLRSDVPVGLLLSGGLDSALLLKLMNENGGPWHTFTVGFGSDHPNDELDASRYTSETLGSQHVSLQLSRQDFEDTLDDAILHLEEPVTASSIVPMYHICRKARQDVKVALVGQGPDELMGGYRRHLAVRYGQYWRVLPRSARRMITGVLARFSNSEGYRRLSYALDEPDREGRIQSVLSLLSETEFRQLVPNLSSESRYFRDIVIEMGLESRHMDELGALQHLELRYSLPDELLLYADKLSMAHGLEVRVPYLDHEIVEFVERLPSSYKVKRGVRKWLHRRICRRLLPKRIVDRKKLGFHAPVEQWFRDSMSGRMDRVINDRHSRIFDYVDKDEAMRLYARTKNGASDHSKVLFSLVALESWLQVFTRS